MDEVKTLLYEEIEPSLEFWVGALKWVGGASFVGLVYESSR